MHPPLKIIDQTDEMIAIEWLRENGYNTYAEHMEADLEKPRMSAMFFIWINSDSESMSTSQNMETSRSWSGRGERCNLNSYSYSNSKIARYGVSSKGSTSGSRHYSKRSSSSVR